MKGIPYDKLKSVKANIHDRAHGAIDDWQELDWHSDGSGSTDCDVSHSSQAFCISVWGSLFGHSDAIGLGWLRELASLGDNWAFMDREPNVGFEYAEHDVLNERGKGKPTNIDVLLSYEGHVVAVESKLTENFGSCSQVRRGFCTGIYESGSDLKTRSNAPCRLQIGDGGRTPRKYWDVMERLCVPGAFPIGEPCPYAGPAYQVMRNIAFAAEMGLQTKREWWVLFAFPASSKHDTFAVVDSVVRTLKTEHQQRVATVDYDQVASGFQVSDSEPVADLGNYMASRLNLVK